MLTLIGKRLMFAIPSLIGNIAEPLIWLVAFGYGMGALVGQVSVGETKVPYILFLASGSICMSACAVVSPSPATLTQLHTMPRSVALAFETTGTTHSS